MVRAILFVAVTYSLAIAHGFSVSAIFSPTSKPFVQLARIDVDTGVITTAGQPTYAISAPRVAATVSCTTQASRFYLAVYNTTMVSWALVSIDQSTGFSMNGGALPNGLPRSLMVAGSSMVLVGSSVYKVSITGVLSLFATLKLGAIMDVAIDPNNTRVWYLGTSFFGGAVTPALRMWSWTTQSDVEVSMPEPKTVMASVTFNSMDGCLYGIDRNRTSRVWRNCNQIWSFVTTLGDYRLSPMVSGFQPTQILGGRFILLAQQSTGLHGLMLLSFDLKMPSIITARKLIFPLSLSNLTEADFAAMC